MNIDELKEALQFTKVEIYSSHAPEKDICGSIYDIDYYKRELYCLVRDDKGATIVNGIDVLRQVIKPRWVKAIANKQVYFLWSEAQ